MDIVTDLRQAIDAPTWVENNIPRIKLDSVQKSILRSNAKQIIYLACRQAGKSETASLLSLHMAIYRPSSLILLLSPSLRQSSELFRKVSDHANECLNLPGKTEDSKLFCTFENGSRIVSLPGREATVRGYAAVDLLVVDEAALVPDSLYMSIRPMLAISGGRLLLISSPHGARGFFFETWVRGGDSWEKYKMIGQECERISNERLEYERASIPSRWFRQEWQVEFLQDLDSVFDIETIRGLFGDVKPMFQESLISEEVKAIV